MFKPSPKAVLLATVTFLSAAALPGIALAKQGNGHGNGNSSTTNNNSNSQGGGPPACRDLQGGLDDLQHMVSSLVTTVNGLSATVNATNATVNTLGARIDTINTTVNATNTTVSTLSSRIDTINANLDDLQSTVDDIQATLQAQGIGGLQASVVVDEAACVSGASQCASATAAASTNQNPVALNVLVMSGDTPVTNLTAANFQLTTDFFPGVAATNLVFCTAGDTGCGSGTFVVNSGSGGYQLWVSPTSNWAPGTYTAQLRITDTLGHSTTQLVKITIPA
jgi:outer membrane murein-binding lipoprotein Lpp